MSENLHISVDMLILDNPSSKIPRRLQRSYIDMMRRCYKNNVQKYNRYGGRGIAVCEEWRNDRSKFFAWALANGYASDLTIDRIDNDGDYSPSNCRWSTKKRQCNNRSTNVLITYNGLSQTCTQWAEELGIKADTLSRRITRFKWDATKAFTTPVIRGGRH